MRIRIQLLISMQIQIKIRIQGTKPMRIQIRILVGSWKHNKLNFYMKIYLK